MPESKRILLVGGGLTELVIRTFVLEESGFKVTAVDNYGAAEPLLSHTDLVILDWASADAVSAFRFIRETSPECPVIVIASVPISEGVRGGCHRHYHSFHVELVLIAIRTTGHSSEQSGQALGLRRSFVSESVTISYQQGSICCSSGKKKLSFRV